MSKIVGHELYCRNCGHEERIEHYEFEFDYNDDVTEYTAITIMGKRFEI